MYYGGPGGYPQPGGRGAPMGYPQQGGNGGMPRPRFYAPPGQMPMPGMAPMAPYGQQGPPQQQQFNQYPQQQQQQPPRGPATGAPRANLPPSNLPAGVGRPINGGALPPNGVPRPAQAGQAQQPPRGPAPAGGPVARAGYKANAGARGAEETINGSGLTAAVLANAAPQEQKQMLGEALYPKIHASQPELAGKITGMLLEMDSSELLYLLENDEALAAKVSLMIPISQFLLEHLTDHIPFFVAG